MLPFKTVVKFIWFGQWPVPCHTINIVRKASRDMYTSRILSYIYHTPITPLSSNHLLKIAWVLPKLGLPLDHHWFPYFKKALVKPGSTRCPWSDSWGTDHFMAISWRYSWRYKEMWDIMGYHGIYNQLKYTQIT